MVRKTDVSMSDEEVTEFLDSKPEWMTLTTIGKDGAPHSVPLGYFRIGEEIYLGCRDGTQKVVNIRRNPNVCVMVQTGKTMGEIKGVMIQGTAEVVSDPEEFLKLRREGARQRGVPENELPTEPNPGSAYIRVNKKRVISWDFSKKTDNTHS